MPLKITKFQILGLFNCLLAIPPLLILLGIILSPPPEISINTLIHEILPNLVLLGCLGINLYLPYLFFWKKYDPTKFKHYLALTLLTVFWFVWLMLGYFFASLAAYPVISLAIAIGIFFFVKKLSIKLAITALVITLMVTILAVLFGFEEDYCVRKGDQMAKDKPGTILIPAKEAREMFGGSFNEMNTNASGSAEIGRAAYYHFKCHESFDFGKVLREKYFFEK